MDRVVDAKEGCELIKDFDLSDEDMTKESTTKHM